MIAPHSPVDADPMNILKPPSWSHWFGTDVSGMDILSRVIYATRINLLISVTAVSAAFVVGVPIGLLIGIYTNAVSTLVMRVFAFIPSFPVFVLGIALGFAM